LRDSIINLIHEYGININIGDLLLPGSTNGQVLKWDGTAWVAGTDANTTYSGSTSITMNSTSFQRAALTGDVTASANSNATTIANNAVTSAKILDGTILAADLNQMGATNNQVLKWNGTAWKPAADNNDNTTYSGSTSITLSGTSFQRAALTGDVTASANNNATTVTAIRGKNVSTTAPTSGQVLRFDGTNWAPAASTTEAWGLNGNSIAATNFIGTTNAQPLVFKVNNTHGGRISNNDAGTSYGYNALPSNTGTFYCTAIGNNALKNANAAISNTAVGYDALSANVNGTSNTAVGTSALEKNTAGYNTAMGSQSLKNNTTGTYNSAFGWGALYDNTTGSRNVGIGYNALSGNTTGSQNIGIGESAGSSHKTGNNNVMIGHNVQSSSPSATNTVSIGSNGITATTYRMWGTWTNASDRRLKQDILPIGQGLAFVSKLKPVEFVYNTGSGGKTLGFIAQEVQETMQTENMSGYNLVQVMNQEDGMLGLNSTELIPILTKAIQEQQAIIETLMQRIEALENR